MNYKTISNYTQFRSRCLHAFATTDTCFNAEELEKIIEYTDKLTVAKGLVAGGSIPQDDEENIYRKSNISFFHPTPENDWIFKKLNASIEDLNSIHFNFDLNGYDSLQYTEYNSTYEGKYDWHMDSLLGVVMPDKMFEMRKLSFSLILSEPGVDYEGGEFEMLINSTTPTTIPAKKGTIIFFPSFMLHRVNTVTKGKRKSIVGWITGPKFR